MFFEINHDKLVERTYLNIDQTKITIGLLSLEEFLPIYKDLGIDIDSVIQCQKLSKKFQHTPFFYPNYHFGLLHILGIETMQQSKTRFAFYLMPHLFLIIQLNDANGMIRSSFDSLCEYATTQTSSSLLHLFASFMTMFLTKDNELFEKYQLELAKLEIFALHSDSNEIKTQLFHWRKNFFIIFSFISSWFLLILYFMASIL